MFKVITTKPKSICSAYRCKNKRAAKSRFCAKHRHRYYKATNPVGYAFWTLQSNAKRRGKEFTLSLDEFKSFCEATGYMDKKGKTALSASIDRIDNTKGYSLDNIRILSLGDNSSKGSNDTPF